MSIHFDARRQDLDVSCLISLARVLITVVSLVLAVAVSRISGIVSGIHSGIITLPMFPQGYC